MIKAFGWYFRSTTSFFSERRWKQPICFGWAKEKWLRPKFLPLQTIQANNFQFKNSARNLLQGTVTTNQQSLKLNQTKRLQPKVKEKMTGGESFFFRSNLDQQPFEDTFTKELKSFDHITNLKKWWWKIHNTKIQHNNLMVLLFRGTVDSVQNSF